MNSYPNSDCKQCTESKLCWVYSSHTQNPGCAHTARSAHVVGAAARTARWSRSQPAQVALAARASRARSQSKSRTGRAHSAQVVGACSNLPALPSQTAQVATSFPCRDLLEAIPCRDITLVSRHHSAHSGRDTRTKSRSPGRPTYVVT